MRNRIILLLIGFMCYAGMGNAQEDKTEKAVPAIVSDSVEVAAPDSTVQAVLMAADSVGVPEVKMKLAFKPNPTKAVLFALVPGLGLAVLLVLPVGQRPAGNNPQHTNQANGAKAHKHGVDDIFAPGQAAIEKRQTRCH